MSQCQCYEVASEMKELTRSMQRVEQQSIDILALLKGVSKNTSSTNDHVLKLVATIQAAAEVDS
jgi:sialic acid synthase SpsE